jgi:hypothetical protein
VAPVGELRKLYKVLEGRRPLGSPKCRCEDGIIMDLGEIGWRGCGMDSIGSG